MQDKFIYVQDECEVDKLIKAGYRLIEKNNNGMYVFENNKTPNFELCKKCVLTNTLIL